MRLNDYQSETQRTAGSMELAVIALGISGEAGEIADHIKKHLGHGHDLDLDSIVEEVGDVLWYLATLLTRCGVTFETAAVRNLRKLERRYPDGFSVERSIFRDE